MVLGFLKIYFAVFIDDMERADIMEEEDREMGRKRGKGPVKETADKEEQEEGRMGKGGTVKETMNKEEQRGERTRENVHSKEELQRITNPPLSGVNV